MPAVTIHMDLRQLAPAYRALGPRLRVAAIRGARRGGLRAVSTLKRATSRASPSDPGGKGVGGAVNTGHYKRSWKMEALPDGARVFNDATYASIIESGRRAGSRFPPLGEIQQWAQRRLGLSKEEAKRAAFPIARAIAKRGLQARQVLAGQLPDIDRHFREEVEKELDRELSKAGGGP